jgi:tetratricopeptide (TPR) repeat protein
MVPTHHGGLLAQTAAPSKPIDQSATKAQPPKQNDPPRRPKDRWNPNEVMKPSPEVLKLRREIRDYMAKQAKRPLPRSLQEINGPFNPFSHAQEYRDARGDKPKLYLVLGRDLALADRLLIHEDLKVRRSGVAVAKLIILYAYSELEDYAQCVKICDAYLAPNFALADEPFLFSSQCALLQTAVSSYSKAKEYAKHEEILRVVIELAYDRNTEDTGRFSLGNLLFKQGKYDQALAELDPQKIHGINCRLAVMDLAKRVRDKQVEQAKENAAKPAAK